MQQPLEQFIKALRAAEVRVSVAEAIEVRDIECEFVRYRNLEARAQILAVRCFIVVAQLVIDPSAFDCMFAGKGHRAAKQVTHHEDTNV